MAGKKNYDLNKAKILLIQGKKLKEVSEKLEIPYSYLAKLSSQNGWAKKGKRTVKKIEEKTQQKTIEKVSDKLSDRNVRHLELFDLILNVAEDYLKNKKYNKHVYKEKFYIDGKPESEDLRTVELDTPDTKALHNIVSALEKSQKAQRLAEGLDKEKDNNTQAIINIIRPERT